MRFMQPVIFEEKKKRVVRNETSANDIKVEEKVEEIVKEIDEIDKAFVEETPKKKKSTNKKTDKSGFGGFFKSKK